MTGGALLLATFAVLGSPPFGVFLSELTIVRAGFAHGSPVFPLLLLALLGVAFFAFARTITAMVTGEPAAAGPGQPLPGPGGGRGDRRAADPRPGGAAGARAVDPRRAGHASCGIRRR